MKKFTLLAAAALIAGTSFAQTEPDVINDLKISKGDDKSQFHYYRMRNMRAMRMDYTNGTLRNQNGDSINKDEGGFFMSPTLVDGETPTPQIYDNPYMGLSQLDGNWWLSFSNQSEIKNPDTEYWYFTWGGKSATETVYINNAVIKGTVSDTAHKAKDLAGYSRSNMDFNNKRGNRYYVLPVRPAFEKVYEETGVNWVDSILKSLTEEELNSAFALCLNPEITADAGDCLDMNNYINIKQYPVLFDVNGDTLKDENGYVQHNRYGFAGVDRTWTPITTTSNKNHWENNGTLFFVEEAPAEEAMAAIERYEKVIQEGYQEGARDGGKSQFAAAVQTLKGWMNLPGVWTNQDKLREILTYCDTWSANDEDLVDVKDTDSRDKYIESVKALADQKLAEAAALVGAGCKVRFKNLLALRDLDSYNNGEGSEFALGNAYLTAGGTITYKDGPTVTPFESDDDLDLDGMGIYPELEANADNLWELQLIPGTYKFRLYNASLGVYIRKYHDMYTYCGGEEGYLPETGISEFSWAATPNIAEAAPFELIGCGAPEDQTPLTAEQIEQLNYAYPDMVTGEGAFDVAAFTDVTNKVRLASNYSVTVTDDAGVPTTTNYSFNIHRASVGSEYKFINWGYAVNNWFADSNAFLIEVEEAGSIDEIGADSKVKAHGIYDLQGRRVAKAGKGIYIIDGKKTFIR